LSKKPKVNLELNNIAIRQPTIEVHPNLPVVPFSLLSVAKSGSGKTNSLCNLILNYADIFKDNLFIFQKTPDLTIEKHLIKNKKINAIRFNTLYDDHGVCIPQAILNQQKELFEMGEEMPHILIYFDDFYDKQLMNPMGFISDLWTAGRHYNISIIQVAHRFKKLLSSHLRSLCHWFMLFRITDDLEKKNVISELSNALNFNNKQFEFCFDYITRQPYRFIFINATQGKFYDCFNEPIECMEKMKEAGLI
jgi:hypothetical protein